MVVVAVQMQFASVRLVLKHFHLYKIQPLYSRMSPKTSTGIDVWISMACLWHDAFTTVKMTVIAKMNVSLSSKAALKTAPVRFVCLGLIQNDSFQIYLGELSRWMPM